MRERIGRILTFLRLKKPASERALQQQEFQSRMADLEAHVSSLSVRQDLLIETITQSLGTNGSLTSFQEAIDTRVGGLQDGFARLDQDLVTGLERLDGAQMGTRQRLDDFETRLAELETWFSSLTETLKETLLQTFGDEINLADFKTGIDNRVSGLQDGFARLDQDLVTGLERLDNAQMTTGHSLDEFSATLAAFVETLGEMRGEVSGLPQQGSGDKDDRISFRSAIDNRISGLQDGFARMDQQLVAVGEAFTSIDKNLVASLERVDKSVAGHSDTITYVRRDLDALAEQMKEFEVDIQFLADRIGKLLQNSVRSED